MELTAKEQYLFKTVGLDYGNYYKRRADGVVEKLTVDQIRRKIVAVRNRTSYNRWLMLLKDGKLSEEQAFVVHWFLDKWGVYRYRRLAAHSAESLRFIFLERKLSRMSERRVKREMLLEAI